jgi:hypothetical protein
MHLATRASKLPFLTAVRDPLAGGSRICGLAEHLGDDPPQFLARERRTKLEYFVTGLLVEA